MARSKLHSQRTLLPKLHRVQETKQAFESLSVEWVGSCDMLKFEQCYRAMIRFEHLKGRRVVNVMYFFISFIRIINDNSPSDAHQ